MPSLLDPVCDAEVLVSNPANCAAALAYLRARAVSGMEVVGTDSYARVVRSAEGWPRIVRFGFDDIARARVVRVSSVAPFERRDLKLLAERLFGLGCLVQSAEDALSMDPVLTRLIAQQKGLRVPGTPDSFELAVRAILGQQVSVARAARLAAEIARNWGDAVPEPESGLTHAFPGPQRLAQADLGAVGLPAVRRQAITTLARRVLDGGLILDGTTSLQRTTEALRTVPGIGPWTCAYIALRALGDLDSIPVQDLGLRLAASGDGVPLSPTELAVRAEAWRPWRGLAAVHLWTTLLADLPGS